MGLFDFLKDKEGEVSGASRTETIEFTLEAGDARDIDDAAVQALDAALAGVATDGDVMHMIDPRRIQRFEAGGPPVWSIGTVTVGADRYFVTYGLSKFIDPAREFSAFELAIRVPETQAGMWAGLFLQTLARYMLVSGRELRVGEFMPFPESITRVAVPPEAREQFPDSKMRAVIVTTDQLLPSVEMPGGPLEVRRIVGLDDREVDWVHLWNPQGAIDLLALATPDLTTDLERPSLADDERFTKTVREGSAREGSAFGFVAVPNVNWEAIEKGYRITFAGEAAGRVRDMFRARIVHGRNLLIHDVDPTNQRAIGLTPAESMGIREEGDILSIHIVGETGPFEDLARLDTPIVTWDIVTH